jgi:hypothetical protein
MSDEYNVSAHEPHVTQSIGDKPTLPGHLHQGDITSGRLSFDRIFAAGQLLFEAGFNQLDGQGRPAATGNGVPSKRTPDQPAMIRTSAPDANSCLGCHAQPRSGGGGDFVANVFVLAQVLDPVTFSVSSEFSNERNTLGMMGAGPIEALAREMTRDLWAIRDAAKAQAIASGIAATRSLDTSGTFSDTSQSYCFDMTEQGESPRLERERNGTVIVRAFTDLKRHTICDADLPHFCNERVVQAGIPTDQFITRKLWDVGNSAPYGHRGDLTTITEAILAHGGEGRAARDEFTVLSVEQQAEVVEFLKTLQILPQDSRIQGRDRRH